ncbi:MAG: outer membrane protein assembly factor BamB [Burkholderiales bacterium]|nr:outer membrane protein assembly factor BamB [Burkholderiales bacterium]
MRVLAAAAAALALAGCSSGSGSSMWRDFSLNPLDWWGTPKASAKMAPLPPFTESVKTRVLWQAGAGGSGGYLFSPAVAGERVYAAAADGSVVALDAATGRQVWRVNAGSRLSAGVGASADLVVVGSEEGDAIAFDADGELRWRARVSSEVLAPPLVTGDLVVVRAADNRIFALDARDGRRRWVYQRSLPPLAVRSPVGVSAGGGLIFAGFSGGRMVALAPANGAVRWEGNVAVPRGTTELERVTDVVGQPWVGDREVCAVAFQGRLTCFDLANGTPAWTRELSSTSGVFGDARRIYASDDKGAVHALDRATGRSLWKQDKLAFRRLSAPLPLRREVAVADVQGYVHLLANDTGAFVGRVATDGSPIGTNPVPLGAGFLVQTRNGAVYAVAVD